MAEGKEHSSFSQVEKEASWRQAMSEELASIEDNNTWDLVDLPAGHKPMGLKWVYKLKKNASGEILKHKARLVSKGYVHKARLSETTAGTCCSRRLVGSSP
jgi:hypothetical protein